MTSILQFRSKTSNCNKKNFPVWFNKFLDTNASEILIHFFFFFGFFKDNLHDLINSDILINYSQSQNDFNCFNVYQVILSYRYSKILFDAITFNDSEKQTLTIY